MGKKNVIERKNGRREGRRERGQALHVIFGGFRSL
jgi:hypothetical protein